MTAAKRDPRYGGIWEMHDGHFKTNQTTAPDGKHHNILTVSLHNPHRDLVTMCGIRLADGWEPFEGVTSCNRCGLLATFEVR